jgi:type II secretory pathway component PulL
MMRALLDAVQRNALRQQSQKRQFVVLFPNIRHRANIPFYALARPEHADEPP